MKTKLGKNFWAAMIIFGLMGQVAWVVENKFCQVEEIILSSQHNNSHLFM